MVNRYVKRPIRSYVESLRAEGVSPAYIDSLVEATVELLVSCRSREEATARIAAALNALLSHSRACALPPWAEYCRELFGWGPDPLVETVKRAVDALLGIEGFYHLVPEVGSNLVYDPTASGNPATMIAVDGRIVRGEGRVHIAGNIRYGGSRHSARILAAVVERYGASRRTLLVIANRDYVRIAAEAEGMRIEYTGPHRDPVKAESEIIDSIKSVFGDRPPDLILDLGGPGLEPVGYLIAVNPGAIVEAVKRLVSRIKRD